MMKHDKQRSTRRGIGVAMTAGLALAFAAPAAAEAAPGDILVADRDAFNLGGGGVIRVDPATGARTTTSRNTAPAGGPNFFNPTAIALAPGGDILVADRDAFGGDGGVIRVDASNGTRTTFSANASPAGGPSFADPSGIALAPNGDVLVVDSNTFGGGAVIRVDRFTGARTTLSANAAPAGGPGFVEPSAIALAPAGDILIADPSAVPGGAVIRVDPVSGARTTVSDNTDPPAGPAFHQPVGIALERGGDILIADQAAFDGTGGVIRVNPVSGARTTVSGNAAPAGGPSFVDPYGITLAPNGPILVADHDAFGGGGGVIRVNPVTGARTTVSHNAAPAGTPSFLAPLGIAVSPAPPPPPVLLSGACANERRGTERADALTGTAAGDRLFGLGGRDTVSGLAGRDCLYGGAGSDRLIGGPGRDKLNGGSGNDQLHGGAGRDALAGTRGADRLSGGSGNDHLTGGPGKDRLTGGSGNDRLSGGSGSDRLNGGRGRNRYAAGTGRDKVNARNRRRDRVDCGPGRDNATVDRFDRVRRCERVTRR